MLTSGFKIIRGSERTMTLADSTENQGALECPCETCEGKGGWFSSGGYGKDWTYCGACAGAGHIATPLGRKILELIRHNMPNLTGQVE
jgi:DnaJ-class molecular chaperone